MWLNSKALQTENVVLSTTWCLGISRGSLNRAEDVSTPENCGFSLDQIDGLLMSWKSLCSLLKMNGQGTLKKTCGSEGVPRCTYHQ